jgi:signal transduction histidine kinase
MRDGSAMRVPTLPFHEGSDESLRARVRELEEDRRKILEHALQLERIVQVGLMTSGLAHDLTNQLMSVMGAAELAVMRDDPESLRGGVRHVLEHATRMHDTLDAFLSFVRRHEHRVRVFPVAEAIDAVQRLVQPAARSECVTLLSTAATRACVRADRQLLEQALVNLLMNAVRAAASGGGRVALTATETVSAEPRSARRVRISVRDTGTGMPESVRERLFQPFVTGHAESGGHGLGLYVVRQVVEHYGGRVEVDSTASGTRVDIDLPVAEPAADDVV